MGQQHKVRSMTYKKLLSTSHDDDGTIPFLSLALSLSYENNWWGSNIQIFAWPSQPLSCGIDFRSQLSCVLVSIQEDQKDNGTHRLTLEPT